MKITVYTVTDCEFSKQEKEYLSAHSLAFEEKNLEQNKEWLTEMLAVGSNFAGTPVTKIEKDDGQSVVLKGFTKAEFDEALGFSKPEAVPAAEAPAVALPEEKKPAVEVAAVPQMEPAMPEPSVTTPAEPPAPVAAAPVEPPAPVVEPVMPPAVEPVQPSAPVVPPPAMPPSPAPTSPQDQQLNDLLSSLQTKATEPTAPTPVVPASQTPAAGNAPQIPDFH